MDSPYKILKQIRAEQGGTVTYTHADGCKQRSPVNRQVFTDERGNVVSLNRVIQIFEDTMVDKGFTSYTLSC